MQRVPALALVSTLSVLLSACPTKERPAVPDGGVSDAGTSCNIDDNYTPPTPRSAPLLADNNSPAMACTSAAEVWPESTLVAMGGCLDVFGVGSRIVATTLKVAVYDNDQNPETDSPAYGETDVETSSPEAVACTKGAYYRIEGVPTSKPLLVKVYDSQPNRAMVVVNSYQYRVILDPMDIQNIGGELINFEANVIYSATYQSLPTLAGRLVDGMQDISDGVGRGVIAGEVHDCDGLVLQNVSVVSTCMDDSTRLFYTIGEDCDQPDRSRSTSSECGTYVVLNAEPGLHKIEAWYKDANGTQLLGSGYVHVFADSVSIFSPAGLNPIVDGVDAGTPADAANPNDAWVDVDAQLPPTDAATPADSAASEDAGTATDSAIVAEDAAANTDAGVEDAVVEDI